MIIVYYIYIYIYTYIYIYIYICIYTYIHHIYISHASGMNARPVPSRPTGNSGAVSFEHKEIKTGTTYAQSTYEEFSY